MVGTERANEGPYPVSWERFEEIQRRQDAPARVCDQPDPRPSIEDYREYHFRRGAYDD